MVRRLGFSALCAVAAGAPDGHRITRIPGYGEPKTKQFAGFLNVSVPDGTMHYHYWMASSSSAHPENDPLVFWFQGGPGANSVAYGLLTEHGPYYLDPSSEQEEKEPGIPNVYENPHSWIHAGANMIWVEHPPGVGFSYCKSGPDASCRWNDDTQAVAAYELLKEFVHQFPEYENNDLYVTGESYGGMYVPTIVEQVHKKGGVNLKGFAIGNGVIGNYDSYPGQDGDETKFLHASRFISEKLWDKIVKACGEDFSSGGYECTKLQREAEDEAGKYYIYNVYDTCDVQASETLSSSRSWLKTTQEWKAEAFVGQPDSYPCGMEHEAVKWLNLPQVRDALHVPSESWYGYPVGLYPGGDWHYSSSRAHLLDVYPTLLKAYRGLIYNGDFDGCVPYTGAEAWTKSLGFSVKQEWSAWHVDGQVAGYATIYDHNDFTFATVKGAGHMVPQYKARQGLAMIKSFLRGRPLGSATLEEALV